MNDYSEYLNKPGMLAWIELEWQRNKHIHEGQAKVINEAVEKYSVSTVAEIGCSTGNTAQLIKNDFYIGIDSSKASIDIAVTKREGTETEFYCVDIRKLDVPVNVGIVFCFAFLKHFGLHELKFIFNRIALLGRYFIFDIPISDVTKDDGTEFHHVWLSREKLDRYISGAGLELLEVKNPESLEPVFICRKK